jgi:hypothetical protein
MQLEWEVCAHNARKIFCRWISCDWINYNILFSRLHAPSNRPLSATNGTRSAGWENNPYIIIAQVINF